MPRARVQQTQKRHRQINIRVTDDDHARLTRDALRAGMKLTGYCEILLLNPKVEIAQTTVHRMEPVLFAELRRVGNNLNQVAHAINSGLPPHQLLAAQALNGVLQTLLRDELLNRRIEALRMRTDFDGTANAKTGVQLQGRLRVYPARRRQGDR